MANSVPDTYISVFNHICSIQNTEKEMCVRVCVVVVVVVDINSPVGGEGRQREKDWEPLAERV